MGSLANDLAIATYLNPQFKGRFFRDSATKPRIVDILAGQIEARLNCEKKANQIVQTIP